jgi:hypothetical protein
MPYSNGIEALVYILLFSPSVMLLSFVGLACASDARRQRQIKKHLDH